MEFLASPALCFIVFGRGSSSTTNSSVIGSFCLFFLSVDKIEGKIFSQKVTENTLHVVCRYFGVATAKRMRETVKGVLYSIVIHRYAVRYLRICM